MGWSPHRVIKVKDLATTFSLFLSPNLWRVNEGNKGCA